MTVNRCTSKLNPRTKIKKVPLCIRRCASDFTSYARRLRRKALGADKKILESYLQNHSVPKLHIGCGKNILVGWLNADYEPSSELVVFINATRRFPFSNNSFDYVYSEHMIEHISFADGVNMLSEIRRVLKPGGKLRISTPNMKFLIDMYRTKKTPLQSQYISWSINRFIPDAGYDDEVFVINNYFRNWGHTFIYDQQTLSRLLSDVGFVDIRSQDIGISDDDVFCGLENVGRAPEGFVEMESMILEAVCRD